MLPCHSHATELLTAPSSHDGCRPVSTHPASQVSVQLVHGAIVAPQSPRPPCAGATGPVHEAPLARQTQSPLPGAHCATSPSAAAHAAPLEMAAAEIEKVFVQPAVHADHAPTQPTGAAHRHVSKFQVPDQHTWSPGRSTTSAPEASVRRLQQLAKFQSPDQQAALPPLAWAASGAAHWHAEKSTALASAMSVRPAEDGQQVLSPGSTTALPVDAQHRS